MKAAAWEADTRRGPVEVRLISIAGAVGGTEYKAARWAPSRHARWSRVGNPALVSIRSMAGVASGPPSPYSAVRQQERLPNEQK